MATCGAPVRRRVGREIMTKTRIFCFSLCAGVLEKFPILAPTDIAMRQFLCFREARESAKESMS